MCAHGNRKGDDTVSATIKDIAQACGVSVGTVDRALNNRGDIRPATKERILEAAAALHYKPNRIAQSLATGATMTIGVLCFDLYNNFLAALIDGIEASAKEKGYFLNLILTHGDAEKEVEGLQYLADRRVDGILIFPVGHGARYLWLLNSLHIPVVSIYNRISEDFAYVGVDDRRVMSDAVVYLAERGYRRVVYVDTHFTQSLERGDNIYTLKERRAGYCGGLARARLNHPPVFWEGRDFDRMFREGDYLTGPKTAFLCINDVYALALLDYCRQRGIQVPGEVGIMGYDNIDILRYVSPRLTTVEYDVGLLGKRLFDALYTQMTSGKKPENCLLDYRIVEGATV